MAEMIPTLNADIDQVAPPVAQTDAKDERPRRLSAELRALLAKERYIPKWRFDEQIGKRKAAQDELKKALARISEIQRERDDALVKLAQVIKLARVQKRRIQELENLKHVG